MLQTLHILFYLPIYPSILSIYLSSYLTLNLGVQAQHCKRNASNIAHIILSIYLSIYVSIYLSIYVFIYLFIYILSIKEGIYYTRNNNGNVKDMIYISGGTCIGVLKSIFMFFHSFIAMGYAFTLFFYC